MSEQNDLLRLNYFTGFFTTARDWEAEQAYHRQKLALHNQWLHSTPGIVRSVGEELRVEPAGGLKVRVLPGAAMDSSGRAIRLLASRTLDLQAEPGLGEGDAPQVVYVFIAYDEQKTDYCENVEQPQYSGHTRITEGRRVGATLSEPDKQTHLELARVRLQAGATEILDPQDPDHPQDNEIDRRHVRWTGPASGAEPMADEALEQLIQVMPRTRRDFAALADRFPVPSASDVRHGALTMEMLARTGCVHAGRLSHPMLPLAAVQRDVEQELSARYGNILEGTAEFQHYRVAVQELEAALPREEEMDILNAQEAVAQAARELSEIVVESPIADAGRDQTLTTYEAQATVTLDGTDSQARGGREIVRYHWTRE